MKSPENNGWTVVAPTSKESCYSFTVGRGRATTRAYLTYELGSVEQPERNLLMVKRSASRPLREMLSEDDVRQLERLVQAIFFHRSSGSGAIETAKSVVNSIYDGELPIANITVGIHKHGPVPIYLVQGEHEIQLHGRPVQARIGIYQDIQGVKSASTWPNAIADKAQFLRSLEQNLTTIFTRYLEDIGELFFDIEHHLNFRESVEAAHEAEAILSESVGSKINLITRHQNYQPAASSIAQRLLRDYPDVILLARYARTYASFFINRLYRILGIGDFSEEHRSELNSLQGEFDGHHGIGSYDDVVRDTPALTALQSSFDNFLAGSLNPMPSIEPKGDWVSRFVDFGKFVGMLQAEALSPRSARIFVSFQHEVAVSEIVRRITKDYFEKNYNDTLKVLSVVDKQPGAAFKDNIRTKIWLSDSILAVAPQNTRRLATSNGAKDYRWIAREIDFGLGLSKRIAFLIEEGTNRDSLRADFTDPELDFLSPEARRPTRKKELLQYLDNLVSVIIQQRSAEQIDPALREILQSEANLALDLHLESMLSAIFRFFSIREIQALALIHKKYTQSPLTKKQLAPRVFPGQSGRNAEKEFENFRRRVRNRKLIVDGEEFEIVAKLHENRYKSSLLEIGLRLRPDLHPAVLQLRIDRLLLSPHPNRYRAKPVSSVTT